MRAYDAVMPARPTDETREVVTCRILPSLIRKLDDLAVADNRSRSEMIEAAVRELIERADAKRKRGAK